MYRNTYQSERLSILFSVGSHPLSIWRKQTKNGHIRRITDEEIRSLVIELMGTNVATTYISAPKHPTETLGIKLPFLVMLIKNLSKYFSFQIEILDDENIHRRFRISNYQPRTKVQMFCTIMPLLLNPGWNQLHFNLVDFTRKAYGTNYMETTRVQIHANIRIRRIYFADRLLKNEDLPKEYQMSLAVQAQKQRRNTEYKPSLPFKLPQERKEALQKANMELLEDKVRTPPPTPVGSIEKGGEEIVEGVIEVDVERLNDDDGREMEQVELKEEDKENDKEKEDFSGLVVDDDSKVEPEVKEEIQDDNGENVAMNTVDVGVHEVEDKNVLSDSNFEEEYVDEDEEEENDAPEIKVEVDL